MHWEPLAEQRAQVGWSLLHLTLEAAQASQEARSFGRRSRSGVILGTAVGDGTVEEPSSLIGEDTHWEVFGVKDIVEDVAKCRC
jgi:hypothetical protein